MSTLSNVTPGRGKFLPQNVGLTANVSSRESLDGVSVRYAPDPSKKWFVLRATYHRELKAYDYLINHGIEAFLPLHRTSSMWMASESLSSSLIFPICSLFTQVPKL